MREPALPLASKCVGDRYGASGDAQVQLGTRSIGGLWQIAGWDSFESAAENVLQHLGIRSVGNYRDAQVENTTVAWRISPDKVLVETSVDLTSFATSDLAVLELTHARAVIKLAGSRSRDLLAQVVAIEVTATQFKPGEFRQTGIHHVGVLIYCTGHSKFDILVPTTWAETIWSFLFDNALPHGVAVVGGA